MTNISNFLSTGSLIEDALKNLSDFIGKNRRKTLSSIDNENKDKYMKLMNIEDLEKLNVLEDVTEFMCTKIDEFDELRKNKELKSLFPSTIRGKIQVITIIVI